MKNALVPNSKLNAVENTSRYVIISVLNWNSAKVTLKCVESLLALDTPDNVTIKIRVFDNGSSEDDWKTLRDGTDQNRVTLTRLEVNLGFAGGHNIAIQQALDEKADYVWLLNNDAIASANAITEMLSVIENDAECGIVSPLIYALDDESVLEFCGALHDWNARTSVYPNSIENAKSMFANHPNDMWVVGTALFCRLAALRQVGMLDDRLFAYYEDDDICARLSHAGWTSKIAFGTKVLHARTKSRLDERPPYYFYLMARNSIRFWCAHTPKDYRRLLRLKLLDRNLLMANSLRYKGLSAKTQACLLGIFDGLTGRTGAPELSRRTPVVMKILMYFRWWNHRLHIQK